LLPPFSRFQGIGGQAAKDGENAGVSVQHYENFPVASVLCPPALRPAVVAIYHFARTADDIADEGGATPVERLRDLAAYRHDLAEVLSGRSPSGRWEILFVALQRQIQQFALPGALLHDLLDAFEQDVLNPAYEDRAALLEYCRCSANPIGRLLLHLHGIDDAPSLRLSDSVCSALQLINFWQDLHIDGPRNRHYVPIDDARVHAVTRAELATCADSERSRSMVRSLCDWAEGLMREGAPLVHRLPGRAGWELRLVVQGGLRVLEKIRHLKHATLAVRPRLRAPDVPVLLWRAAFRSGTP
jgi:squalene synthase HpnC